MGTERISTNWTEYLVDLKSAMDWAEKDYINHRGHNPNNLPLQWEKKRTKIRDPITGNLTLIKETWKTEDLSFVQYEIRTLTHNL